MAHNFILGGLGFHKLINDEHPYERATAPFRKEQLDTTATTGDQSLTGWWTRGQLSFHKGAGVKYYEVLDGEEVFNRFDTSVGVTPWEPGQVSLDGEWKRITASGSFTDAVSYQDGTAALRADGTVAIVHNDDTVSAATVAGSVAISTLTAIPGGTLFGTSSSTGKIYSGPGGSFTLETLWSPPAGQTLYQAWWAKNRLFVHDFSGNWYTLSSAGGTAASTDIFWASNDDGIGWYLAESPAAVYIARNRNIYAVKLDDTGSVPVITSPTVAATIPTGEHVQGIGWYLGKLLIATNKGIRVAIAQSDGSLVYGPLVITGGAFIKTGGVAGKGDLAYVTVRNDIYALNLATFIDELIPAYCTVNDTGSYGGIIPEPSTLSVLAWDGSGFIRRRDPATAVESSGTLTTGLHRLGTLEPKAFRHLLVKVGGLGGSNAGNIAVSVVLPDGTVTSVGVVTAGTTAELSLFGAVPTPQEYIGLKFTFTRGTPTHATGPILLGYQLKALPMPKRQRLIRVPLMMFDTELGPTGRALGAEKSAWTRLAALEALEVSNAVVTFTDKDTGETGTALIESVELLRRNGSKGVSRSNGFGGVVTVTLRKVA